MSIEESTVHTRLLRKGGQVMAMRRSLLKIAVVRGPDKGQKRQLAEDRISIGSHPSCDVPLTDRAVSRQHCEVLLVRDGYAIRDLDSTNGTYLQKVRIRDVTTDREVRLVMGDSELLLTPMSDTIDVPIHATDRFGPLLGRSPAMRRLFDLLAQVAPTELTVLITGESGTGKEVTARAIHEASPRAHGPFAVVDCASLPPTLIESELYGHVRGAFTGADRNRVGALEAAAGGTLFLDEIGELPLELQSRLLGAIERRRIQPVGSSQPRAIDVRLIAATNRDLRREVNRGTFREDLYFRLAVATVHTPPLRDRPEDIPLYIAEYAPSVALDAAALDRLSRQRWSGNVRELRNTLERALAVGRLDESEIEFAGTTPTVSARVDAAVPYKIAKALLLDEFERTYVVELMRRHGNNITHAARGAELDRVYLLRLLDKYGLRKGSG